MPEEPVAKRTCVFIDGQNLYWAARHAFGYHYPNYDPLPLAQAVTQSRDWNLDTIHFYTGLPDIRDNDFWNKFWTAKLAVMGSRGIVTYSRHLKYRNQTIRMPDGTETTVLVGQEKGIDIRIALDVVRMVRQNKLDVALIFSQDQDLSEVVDEVRQISIQQNRWIKIACAFPVSPTSINKRGINGAEITDPKLTVRDPYIFEFLGLRSAEVMSESHLEDQLLDKLQEFLLELGYGFCFEARQKRIFIGDTHNFVDLVFYHRILKCHVLVELKLAAFSHENIGQLNTYVSWYKKNMMIDGDNPPVGILLCTQKDHALVEYALAGMNNDLFVSKYQLELPKKEEMQRFIEEQMKEVEK